MEKVLVIGGSNVDYIGKCFYDVINEDSNIGNINISFGGVGRNIVENLARLGVDVTFVTNIGQDIMGHELKKELNSLGVTVYTPEGIKKSGGYLAIHDKHGNLSLALCEQSGIEKIEPKYLETLDNLIQSYNYIVIDTNFDKTTISYLLNKYQDKTIFIDAKSAATCRMYTNYDQSVRGISKNIFDFLGKNSIVMCLIVIAIFFFLVIPTPICIVKLFEMRLQNSTYVDTLTFALIINFILSFLSWLMIFATRKLPLYIAFLYPLVHLNLLYIALVSWIRSEQGKGYVWKGRLVS